MNFSNLNDNIVRDFNKVMAPYMSGGEATAWLHVLNVLVPVIAAQAVPAKVDAVEVDKPVAKKVK